MRVEGSIVQSGLVLIFDAWLLLVIVMRRLQLCFDEHGQSIAINLRTHTRVKKIGVKQDQKQSGIIIVYTSTGVPSSKSSKS